LSRIGTALERARREGRIALAAYVTAGFPTPADTPAIVRALVCGGADIVELGVPFSDPLAEGPTIPRSTFAALAAGTTPRSCLEIVKSLRVGGLESPVILMGYYNPILAWGPDQFAADAAAAGVDGVIAVDLPPEESDELRAACRAQGMDLIYLLAPTSTEERVQRVAELASGFIYCVSVTGVTGAREALSAEVPGLISRVRAATRLPLAVGFGISRRAHVAALAGMADVAVVGSAIIDIVETSPPQQREERVQGYVEVLTGRRGAAG